MYKSILQEANLCIYMHSGKIFGLEFVFYHQNFPIAIFCWKRTNMHNTQITKFQNSTISYLMVLA